MYLLLQVYSATSVCYKQPTHKLMRWLRDTTLQYGTAESHLLPTWAWKIACQDISTECSTCHQGKGEKLQTNTIYSHALLRIHVIRGQRSVTDIMQEPTEKPLKVYEIFSSWSCHASVQGCHHCSADTLLTQTHHLAYTLLSEPTSKATLAMIIIHHFALINHHFALINHHFL